MPGELTVEDDAGNVILGPFPCRGKADGQIATAHSNPDRLPTLPFGDHPSGKSVIVSVQPGKQPGRSYGPAFLLLAAVDGDALLAALHGREGIVIHGGDPTADGGLRAAEGCLRTTNDAMDQICAMSPTGWEYDCEDV